MVDTRLDLTIWSAVKVNPVPCLCGCSELIIDKVKSKSVTNHGSPASSHTMCPVEKTPFAMESVATMADASLQVS